MWILAVVVPVAAGEAKPLVAGRAGQIFRAVLLGLVPGLVMERAGQRPARACVLPRLEPPSSQAQTKCHQFRPILRQKKKKRCVSILQERWEGGQYIKEEVTGFLFWRGLLGGFGLGWLNWSLRLLFLFLFLFLVIYWVRGGRSGREFGRLNGFPSFLAICLPKSGFGLHSRNSLRKTEVEGH